MNAIFIMPPGTDWTKSALAVQSGRDQCAGSLHYRLEDHVWPERKRIMGPKLTRRNVLKGTGTSLLALTASSNRALAAIPLQEAQPHAGPLPGDANRAERMKWWKAARFGMFIHFGVYSTIGRHEWVMEDEGIPVAEYAPRAASFHPRPGSPREWAKLARQA